jgi:hypothetical protein
LLNGSSASRSAICYLLYLPDRLGRTRGIFSVLQASSQILVCQFLPLLLFLVLFLQFPSQLFVYQALGDTNRNHVVLLIACGQINATNYAASARRLSASCR